LRTPSIDIDYKDFAMKTIVGSFDSFEEAKRVARDLTDEGFSDADVNVVASNSRGDIGTAANVAPGTASLSGATGTVQPGRPADVADTSTDEGRLANRDRGAADDASGAAAGAVTGGVVGGAAGLAASLMGLAIPGIGPIIAAGPIVATLSGAGVGAVAGGLIGGLTDMGVSDTDAQYYAESVRRGGALVTVRADDSRAERAADIMREHGAVDIERRAEQWRERGWTGWNDTAQPYSTEEIDRERDLYGATDRTTGLAGGMGRPDTATGTGTTGTTTGVRTY
jgi:hypothetical protein